MPAGFLQRWYHYCTVDLRKASDIPSYTLLRSILRSSLADIGPAKAAAAMREE
jgi:hypothetical protein